MNENSEKTLLTKTFFYMFLGLLSTALVSWYVYAADLLDSVILAFPITLLLEVTVVLLFSFLLKKLPAIVVAILFFVYALLNGLNISIIFSLFELQSIVLLFSVSALMFASFAFFGYKTNADLSNWRYLLFGTLIAGIIISIINLFIGNELIDIILDWVILIVFFGVTAYDMNKIKQLQISEVIDPDKLYIYGAMELYLDFINIFLRILSLFGRRK